MPNEFIARNGLIARNTVFITGSLNITGSLSASGDIIPRTNLTSNIGSSTIFYLNVYSANYTWSGTIGSNGGEMRITQGDFRLGRDIPLRWSQTTDSNGTKDVGLRRFNTGSLEIYDGTTNNGALANRRDLIVRNLNSSTATITGLGATSATTTFLLQNSTPTNLMTVLDNGQFTISSPLISLAASQSAYVISQSISASNAVGGNYYAVNITPTFWQTTASQTETAFRVAATFTQSSVLATSGTNIIADFGATSVGSQLTVTDITSGSIYMVNDVSGLPIIEATSDWTVNMYNFPSIVLQKTGSQVNINGTLRVSGSFILPLSQSTAPQTGSAYWSGSLLFIWDGSRYRSSSFA